MTRILYLILAILMMLTWIEPVHAQSSCVLKTGPKSRIEAQKGRWIQLTTDQWEFLRGIYVMAPNTPAGMPDGDRAVLAEVPGKSGGMVFFIDGEFACSPMALPDVLLQMMRDVDASNIAHTGAPT